MKGNLILVWGWFLEFGYLETILTTQVKHYIHELVKKEPEDSV